MDFEIKHAEKLAKHPDHVEEELLHPDQNFGAHCMPCRTGVWWNSLWRDELWASFERELSARPPVDAWKPS